MKRPYETCVVFDGALSDDVVSKEQNEIEQFISANGVMEKVLPWGRRRLAYEIDRKRSGVYFVFQYVSEGDVPDQLAKRFKLNPNIIRYLSVQRYPDIPIYPPVDKFQPVIIEETEDDSNEIIEQKGDE